MWSFSTLKDKRYWILLIIAAVILTLSAVFGQEFISGRPNLTILLVVSFVALFWTVYYVWKYIDKVKGRE